MRRIAALSTAVLLPTALVTATAPAVAHTVATTRGAAAVDVPTYTPGAAGWPSGNGFDVAYRASTENVLYRRFVDGAWSSPLNVAGRLIGGPAVAFAGGSPHVYGRGVDGHLWERIRVNGTWQPWTKVDDLVITAAPAAAGHAGGRVEVFVRDASDRLQTKTYSPGTGWSGWTALGLTARSAPAVAVTGTDTFAGGKTVSVGRGRDGALWSRAITGTTWTTDQQAWIPGPPAAVPSTLRGKNFTKVPTTAKVAALTFDGAWDASGVASIRTTLQRENVPATFSPVGDFARGFPIYSNLLAGSGFRIGNRSNTHPDFTKISDATARTQVTAAKVTARVLAAKTPGMIVLMHVGANPDDGTTLDADALPAIITGLRDAGYSLTTLDALR
ncbi:polysaccharide deacetylase family protein [Spirillospora sp. NPDC048819]|uniref:polysaccharide deacetylase family protein n=1 Tax=Spirillospora sp. NPDC048819 TaxID=3155268 RepID=UPI0033EA5845